MTARFKRFTSLSREAANCQICPRMADQNAILSRRNGSITAPLIFIAEAPGRFGAAKTGIPFQGDRSSENFEKLLAHIGLTRDDIFITNAVLCNPLKNGNNDKPTRKEVSNCSYFLESVLELIKPKVVATLGGTALDALNLMIGKKFKLSETVAKPQILDSFTLLPLYHPSPRVTNWKRTLSKQKQDYKKILSLL